MIVLGHEISTQRVVIGVAESTAAHAGGAKSMMGAVMRMSMMIVEPSHGVRETAGAEQFIQVCALVPERSTTAAAALHLQPTSRTQIAQQRTAHIPAVHIRPQTRHRNDPRAAAAADGALTIGLGLMLMLQEIPTHSRCSCWSSSSLAVDAAHPSIVLHPGVQERR